MLDFPLPFLAPPFYKLDFSELPVMLCGFYLGPSAAVVCQALKIILKLLINSTSTAFVGDLANFVVGMALVLPAVIIYHTKKSKKSALIGLLTGTVCLTVFGTAFNAIYLVPQFSLLYGTPMEEIIALGSAINAGITDLVSFVIICVAPLNLIKGAACTVLTMLLYKRVARPLFGSKQHSCVILSDSEACRRGVEESWHHLSCVDPSTPLRSAQGDLSGDHWSPLFRKQKIPDARHPGFLIILRNGSWEAYRHLPCGRRKRRTAASHLQKYSVTGTALRYPACRT